METARAVPQGSKTAVRKKLKGSADLLWLAACLMVCVAFGAVLLRYLDGRHEVYRLGYDLAAQTQEHSRLLEENRRLLVETALQSNAERLEIEALEWLGLRPTGPRQIRIGQER
ncbi:MAG: cell division protein FtsL [Bradymonadales bacterium]|nr:cell division protein FtsL [Bradymonadales bacterium]